MPASNADPDELIRLSHVPRELRTVTADGETVTYSRLHVAALNDTVPIETRGTRYFARRRDLPVIAARLGLQLRVTPHAPAVAHAV